MEEQVITIKIVPIRFRIRPLKESRYFPAVVIGGMIF